MVLALTLEQPFHCSKPLVRLSAGLSTSFTKPGNQHPSGYCSETTRRTSEYAPASEPDRPQGSTNGTLASLPTAARDPRHLESRAIRMRLAVRRLPPGRTYETRFTLKIPVVDAGWMMSDERCE